MLRKLVCNTKKKTSQYEKYEDFYVKCWKLVKKILQTDVLVYISVMNAEK